MRGAVHVEEKTHCSACGSDCWACSLAANKMSSDMPGAYSIFRKICHVVADSETCPNAAAVARFPRNGVLSRFAARCSLRRRVTEIPDFEGAPEDHSRSAGYTCTLDIFMPPPLQVVELPYWPRPLRGVEEGCALERGFAKRFLQM